MTNDNPHPPIPLHHHVSSDGACMKKVVRFDIPESTILSHCLKWLYAQGLQPIRNNTGGFSKSYTNKLGITKNHHIRVGKKGSGDIIVCNKFGRWIEIEVKAADGKQSLEQIERQKHIEANCGVYLLVRSIDDLEANKILILSSYAAKYADGSLIPKGIL